MTTAVATTEVATTLPKFVTLDELHAACGGPDVVSRRTLERLAAKGKIPGAEKVGRAWLFRRIPVTEWIEGRSVGGAKVLPIGGAR